jgi:hypothetical protein
LTTWERFRDAFAAVVHPDDAVIRAELELEAGHVWVKHRIARMTAPRRIVEFGVRAGYSAWAMVLASGAEYVGYDGIVDGTAAPWKEWALARISGAGAPRTAYHEGNTRGLTVVPEADLYHVDADHSYVGVQHELRLCIRHAPVGAWILMDDFKAAEVRNAALDVVRRHPGLLVMELDSWRGEGLLLKQW